MSRRFEYRIVENPLSGETTFRVYSDPLPADGTTFELTVVDLGMNTVQVVMINHYYCAAYTQKGIPDALLPIVQATLGKEVQSSPVLGHGNIYRTPAATKVWQRLVSAGKASYDPATSIYRLT